MLKLIIVRSFIIFSVTPAINLDNTSNYAATSLIFVIY